jgi:hypothetical protein
MFHKASITGIGYSSYPVFVHLIALVKCVIHGPPDEIQFHSDRYSVTQVIRDFLSIIIVFGYIELFNTVIPKVFFKTKDVSLLVDFTIKKTCFYGFLCFYFNS